MPTIAKNDETTSQNGRYLGRTIAGFALIAVLLVTYFQKATPEPTLAERYPGLWQTSTHEGIARTLVKNQIRNCGQLQYRRAAEQPDEYLVYCTRDGANWSAYLVFTAAEKVTGPTTTDPTLPP